jgi:hypothetical protein
LIFPRLDIWMLRWKAPPHAVYESWSVVLPDLCYICTPPPWWQIGGNLLQPDAPFALLRSSDVLTEDASKFRFQTHWRGSPDTAVANV